MASLRVEQLRRNRYARLVVNCLAHGTLQISVYCSFTAFGFLRILRRNFFFYKMLYRCIFNGGIFHLTNANN